MKCKFAFIIILILISLHTGVWGQAAFSDTQEVSLYTLLEQASSGNESIESLMRKLSADSLMICAARGGFLPELDLNTDLSVLDMVPNTKQPYIGDGPLDILLTGNISQKLWDGGRTRADVKSLTAAQGVESVNLRILEQSVRFRVAEAYYRLIGLEQELKVIDENIAMLDDRIRYVGLLVDAGRMSELDRGRFEVARAQLRGKRLQTVFAYESTCRTIGVLSGLDTAVFYKPVDTLTALSADELENISVNMVDNLNSAPIVDKQRAIIEKSEAELKKTRTGRMPTLSARLWYGWEFADAGFSFTDNERWFMGVFANVPLFDGMSTSNRIKASQISRETASIEYERVLRETETGLYNLLEQLGVIYQRYLIGEEAAELARGNLRLGILEYEAGRRSNMDIIDMQNNLLQAQLALNGLLVEYNMTKSKILSILGSL